MNIAAKATISAIKKWNDKYDVDNQYSENNFMEQFDYKLATIQMENMFQMIKSKAINSIHYFSNKFVVKVVVMIEYPKLLSLF